MPNRQWPALLLAALLTPARVAEAAVPDLAQCDDLSNGQSASLLQLRARGSSNRANQDPNGYYWTGRAGGQTRNSTVPFTSPSDFADGPAWTWPNEDDEQVRHSPLIDNFKNVYLMTTTKIRKFSENGELLWTWDSSGGKMTCSPALSNGHVYAMAGFLRGTNYSYIKVIAINMDTGEMYWSTNIPGLGLTDSGTVLVTDGVCIVPSTSLAGGGADWMHAVNASDGQRLWDYDLGEVVWNFSPATNGDGTLLVSGSCGGAARISLQGKELWRAGPKPVKMFCSTGGGSIGSNGVYYTEHNANGITAEINAYVIETGALLWTRRFMGYLGGQYPAVGPIGKDGRLAVVAALGVGPSILPRVIWAFPWLHRLYLRSPMARKLLLTPVWPSAVVALDASTGEQLWKWKEEDYDHWAAKGDEGMEMVKRYKSNSVEGSICLPDPQAIPVISGDGHVYSSSSHAGNLTVIRDENADGIIQPEETTSLEAGMAFLNSPSFAPKMIVVAPCWGKMQVFKD